MKRTMKTGFTLAEVLITLAIIGVVAAMSIPALIGSTNQQEYKVAFKKAVAVLNQAITMSIALDSTDAASCPGCSADGTTGGLALANYFRNRLNIIADGPAPGNSFYTADGMLYSFFKRSTNACSVANTTTTTDYASAPCIVLVDINGIKGPNSLSTGSGNTAVFKDQYYVIIKDSTAVPGFTANTTVAQDALNYANTRSIKGRINI